MTLLGRTEHALLSACLLPRRALRTARALARGPADSERLAEGIEGVREDLRVLTAELGEIKRCVEPLHRDLGSLREGFDPMPETLEALRTDLSGLPFVNKS